MSTSNPISLDQIVLGSQLPALPQSAMRLLQLSQDPENGPAEFAVPIESDPGLAGQVLRFVNSSYFGFAREISSVRLALSLVGVRAIQNFTLWSAVFSVIPNPKCGALDVKVLWQDCLRRGLFSRSLGRRLKLKEAEDLFTAALLQDLAIPVLAKELKQRYAEVFDAAKNSDATLATQERAVFGWDHAEAGGKIAQHWNLPESITRMIQNHTRPLAELPDVVTRIVALSAMVPSVRAEQWDARETFIGTLDGILKQPNLVSEVFEEVDKGFSEIAPMLKLGGNVKPLTTAWLQEASPV
ncbi:MAG: hypothetical protein RIS70_4089 [Planctomycetota bacterium]